MFCTNCSKQLKEDAQFCTNCGKSTLKKTEGQIASHVQPTPIRSVKGMSKGWKIALWIIGILIVISIISNGSNSNNQSNDYAPGSNTNSANQNPVAQPPQNAQPTATPFDNAQSVVDVICDNGKGGSGTIFTTDGVVLTNNHVIAGSTSCHITIPDPTTGNIAEVYTATPVITPTLSEQYDIATLNIDGPYIDKDGKRWGEYPTTFPAFETPSTCDVNAPSKLGDSVRIYGYPVTSGGYNLTITDGIISSFADDGTILTSAKIDSGNSGGLAIDQNGCFLGIPSAVESGNYQNLGVIITGSLIKEFFDKSPSQ